MKKSIICFFIMLVWSVSGYGYLVCGPRVSDKEYVGTSVVKVGEMLVGYWAVGSGCGIDGDIYDVSQLCDNIVAGGEVVCAGFLSNGSLTATYDLISGNSTNQGHYCWCRRTYVLRDGELAHSIGQWVYTHEMGSLQNCQNGCATFCADNVANNTNGYRNILMLLTAF